MNVFHENKPKMLKIILDSKPSKIVYKLLINNEAKNPISNEYWRNKLGKTED